MFLLAPEAHTKQKSIADDTDSLKVTSKKCSLFLRTCLLVLVFHV